jgi:hypothetical protein
MRLALAIGIVGWGLLSDARATEDSATRDPAATVEAEGAYRAPNRVWFRLAGFGGASGYGYKGDDLPPVIGGLYGTGGAEMGFKNGVTFGVEIAPFTWVSETTRPSITARLSVGYAKRNFALAIEAGSALTWLFPQLGATMRVGKLDGSYARLRVSWALYPAKPVPVDLSLEISSPVAKKLRVYGELGAVYDNTTGAFAVVGLQVMPGGSRNPRGGAITVGAGVGWMEWALGPMVTLGYERHL